MRLQDDSIVFEGRGVNACLEAQGDLEKVLIGMNPERD